MPFQNDHMPESARDRRARPVTAAALRRARERARMTQEQLADAAEVSVRTVRRALRDGVVRDETLRALCAVLEITIPVEPETEEGSEQGCIRCGRGFVPVDTHHRICPACCAVSDPVERFLDRADQPGRRIQAWLAGTPRRSRVFLAASSLLAVLAWGIVRWLTADAGPESRGVPVALANMAAATVVSVTLHLTLGQIAFAEERRQVSRLLTGVGWVLIAVPAVFYLLAQEEVTKATMIAAPLAVQSGAPPHVAPF